MHCGKKWWIREFVAPYIFPLNLDYVAARSLRSLRSNKPLQKRGIPLSFVTVYLLSLQKNSRGIICVFPGVLEEECGKFTKMENSLILVDGSLVKTSSQVTHSIIISLRIIFLHLWLGFCWITWLRKCSFADTFLFLVPLLISYQKLNRRYQETNY